MLLVDLRATPRRSGIRLSSTLPEPSTWAMMALGFAGLGFAAYRRAGAAARREARSRDQTGEGQMAQPFVGQVIAVGFNFAPVGWHICDGSLLPISQYDALFYLIGTNFGGDGQTTFGLPDLRGRAASGWARVRDFALHPRPARRRRVGYAYKRRRSEATPMRWRRRRRRLRPRRGRRSCSGRRMRRTRSMRPAERARRSERSRVSSAGGGLPHENRQPSLAITYIISLFGIFPSQN